MIDFSSYSGVKITWKDVEGIDCYVDIYIKDSPLPRYNITPQDESLNKPYHVGFNPCRIYTQNEGLDDSLFVKRAEIDILSEDHYLLDYIVTNNMVCEIYKGNDHIFYGLIDTKTYNQDYAQKYNIITISAECPISSLEHNVYNNWTDYATAKQSAVRRSIKTILNTLFVNYDVTIWIQDGVFVDKTLDDFFLEEHIFYGDDIDSYMNNKDILFEICRYLNIYCICYNKDVFLFTIPCNTTKFVNINNISTSKVIDVSIIDITIDDYSSNDTQISLLDKINKANITSSIDVSDILFNDITSDTTQISRYYPIHRYATDLNDDTTGHEICMSLFKNDTITTRYYDRWYNKVRLTSELLDELDPLEVFRAVSWLDFCPLYYSYNDTKLQKQEYYDREDRTGSTNDVMMVTMPKYYWPTFVNEMSGRPINALDVQLWDNIRSMEEALYNAGGLINIKTSVEVSNIDQGETLYILFNGGIQYQMQGLLNYTPIFSTGGGSFDTTEILLDSSYTTLQYTKNGRGTGYGYANYISDYTNVTTPYTYDHLYTSRADLKTPAIYREYPSGDMTDYIKTRDLSSTYYTIPEQSPKLTRILQPVHLGGTTYYTYSHITNVPVDGDKLVEQQYAKYQIQKYPTYDLTDTTNKVVGTRNHYNFKIKKMPLLVCEMKSGNKYCVEVQDPNNEEYTIYKWMTKSEATSLGITNLTFTLGTIPENGTSLLNELSFTNNILTTPFFENGEAIPITKEDNLSNSIEFKVIAPYMLTTPVEKSSLAPSNCWSVLDNQWHSWQQDTSYINPYAPDVYKNGFWTSVCNSWRKAIPCVNLMFDSFTITGLEGILVSSKSMSLSSDTNEIVYSYSDNSTDCYDQDYDFVISSDLTDAEKLAKSITLSPGWNYMSTIDNGNIHTLTSFNYSDGVTTYSDYKPEILFLKRIVDHRKRLKHTIDTSTHIKTYDPSFNKYSFSYEDNKYYKTEDEIDITTNKCTSKYIELTTILPYEAEIEYISTQGLGYIDTLINPSNTIDWQVDFMYLGHNGSNGALFGAKNANTVSTSNNNWTNSVYIATTNDIGAEDYMYNIGSVITITNGNRYLVEYKNRKVYINSVLRASSENTQSYKFDDVTYGLLKFRLKSTAGYDIRRGFNARLYGCKIWDNGELVRDFIPVRMKYEGDPEYAKFSCGLYDKISKTVFRSPIGNLIAGPDK